MVIGFVIGSYHKTQLLVSMWKLIQKIKDLDYYMTHVVTQSFQDMCGERRRGQKMIHSFKDRAFLRLSECSALDN